MRKSLYVVLVSAVSVFIMVSDTGCANIIPPTGGPRDSLPPELIAVIPKDSTLNFTGNRIVFNFNEYVDLQNLQENLIVSPTPKIAPLIEYKLRTVTVRIKDTLELNTTYSLNFGNSLRDINEGNVLRNFTYVFSTGNALDKNQLSGKVILAETGKVDSTLIVLLHRSGDDSAVYKFPPRYFTRLDSSGNFNFNYLPSDTFYVYALKDEGASRRYQSKAQLFAFDGKAVQVGDNNQPITLYAYVEDEEDGRKPKSTVTAPDKKKQEKRLQFQANLDNGRQELIDSFELSFTTPLKTFDSSKIAFTDINFQALPEHSYFLDSTRQRLAVLFAWQPDSTYNIILDKDFADDSIGSKILKTDTITFKAKAVADYGTLRLRFPTLDLQRKPVLQFVQSGNIVLTHTFTNAEFVSRLFKPGDYEIRILYDENGNGKWDPGEFMGKHIQPEKVQAVEQKVQVKANWDNDVRISL